MHIDTYADSTPDKPAIIMGGSGEVITYRQLEDHSNQAAQLFRSLGLETGDAIAIYMENNAQFLEICWAANRAGLYYTAISSQLTAGEAQYIVDDCDAKILITSHKMLPQAEELKSLTPNLTCHLIIGGDHPGFESWEERTEAMPTTPIADETPGQDMLYSSGTTGRPKGIRVPLTGGSIDVVPELVLVMCQFYQMTADSIYLSPAPLYHAAPLRFSMMIQRMGGTVIVMEHFDPEQALSLIEKYKANKSQWVPTMFVRMLKLPEDVRARYDCSSMKMAIHAAAPCPIPVKKQMMEWWGPILHEYYGATESNGLCAIGPEDWLTHEGSVGPALFGTPHIIGEDGEELPPNEPGTIYFSGGRDFTYHKDEERTKEVFNKDGWSTIGDLGYLDEEGYLYLTDRKAFMIITGGVNVYPQEIENLLITHPKVADVAVIGVPNEDFGEEVKAVIQPMDWESRSPELAEDLIHFCKEHLSPVKCPRSIDFEEELPRHPTGKLYKRILKDRYWGKKDSKIV